MSRPPLHALQGFVAAARLGNLSKAADALHLTVSALSHQMRHLEERLGERLFVRGPRGVRLTSAGERLLARVAAPMEALEQALRPVSPRRDEVLTLSLMPSVASAWLVPRLPGFLAAHPRLELSLLSSNALVDFELDTQVDAAIRYGRGRWPGLVVEHLLDETLAPVASPDLIARMGGLPGPGELHRWPLLGETGDDPWGDWFTRYGGPAPARYVATFSELESLHRAALDGLGVPLARLARARLLIERGQLVRLSAQAMPTDYAYYLVYPPRSSEHLGLRAFREWLHAQVREGTTAA